jgi:dihydropteroate synthase
VLSLRHPVVMGILNVTPDSFSDGGRHPGVEAAVAHALAMHAEGAAIIDVGGESTRPGAAAISVEAEMQRVVPVIGQLAAVPGLLISVDTSRAEVITAAARAGAHMVNDVRALQLPGACAAAVASGLAICLVHMRGEPQSMQRSPRYDDVVAEVIAFLRQRVTAATAAGAPAEQICIDPGIGFGKSLVHNLELLGRLAELDVLGLPVLIGASRKSLLQKLTERPVNERLPGSIALATIAVMNGARIIRAHDVAATVDAVRVAAAVQDAAVNQESRS